MLLRMLLKISSGISQWRHDFSYQKEEHRRQERDPLVQNQVHLQSFFFQVQCELWIIWGYRETTWITVRTFRRSSHHGTVEKNTTRNCEVAVSIPGLAQWVKDLALPELWWVSDKAQILQCCGSGVGLWLQLRLDPYPGNLHMPQEAALGKEKIKERHKIRNTNLSRPGHCRITDWIFHFSKANFCKCQSLLMEIFLKFVRT